MYLGRVVEIGESELLYEHPRHPYTAALLSAVPRAEVNGGVGGRKRIVLGGDVPSPVNPPAACVFHPRCPRFQAGLCDVEMPELRRFDGDHEAACHFPIERWPMTEEEFRHPVAVSAPAVSGPRPSEGRLTPDPLLRRLSQEMMRWRRTTACERAAQWISLDLDDELGELDRAALAKHLERCPGCRALQRGDRRLHPLLRIQPLETPPPAIAVQVARPRARVNAAAGRRRGRRRHGGRGRRATFLPGAEPDAPSARSASGTSTSSSATLASTRSSSRRSSPATSRRAPWFARRALL